MWIRVKGEEKLVNADKCETIELASIKSAEGGATWGIRAELGDNYKIVLAHGFQFYEAKAAMRELADAIKAEQNVFEFKE